MIQADKSLVLRYIVPFSFHSSYDALLQRIHETPVWTLCPQPVKKAVVFSHLYQSIYGNGCDNSMGSTWGFRHTNKLPQLLYTGKTDQDATKWRISQAQIHLFHTGIGLLWYELELVSKTDTLDLEELIQMQNQFKDCSYTGTHFRIHQRSRSKDEADTYTPFDAAVWIDELLRPLGDFHYLNGTCLKNGRECPDKALIFNYILLHQSDDLSDQALRRIAFWLANGYTQKYLPSEEALSAGMHPFTDVCLYASRGGCGYYAAVNEGNQAFFTGNFNDNIRKDYFFLYILVLYQSFSLMHFSQKCAAEFPSDPRFYNESIEMGARLDTLVSELNTFLMKGMHSSVSSVQHHNDFYNYLKTRLMIQEDIESIRIGTEALVEIQHMRREQNEALLREAASEEENRRDRRQNAALSMLSLFSLVAVFQDLDGLFQKITALDYVDLWQQICAGSWLLLAEVIVYVLFLIISICCILVLITSFSSGKKKNPHKKD